MTLFDVVNRLGFCDFYIAETYMINFVVYYFPVLLFQIIMGTYIYRHFCTASVYYFSRVQCRIRWYIKEAAKLYLMVAVYLIIVVAVAAIIAALGGGISFTYDSIILFVYYIIIQSLWLYAFTLLSNVLSVKCGSSNAFAYTLGFQALCMLYFAMLQNYFVFEGVDNVRGRVAALKLNPISHIVLHWHSSKINSVNDKLNAFAIDFDLNESVIVCLCIAAAVSVAGGFIIKNQELIVINRESGGTI